MSDTDKITTVKFYLDPACPWCWRANLWIRQVATVRPIKIEWKFFSLTMVNEQAQTLAGLDSPSEPALRTMALLQQELGNDAVGKFYLAIGQARHERLENLEDHAVIRAALREANLADTLLDKALADNQTVTLIDESHNEAIDLKAFGVPTLILSEGHRESLPMYGPVITTVPEGAEAGEWWDHFAWLTWQPNFFELKRGR
jgi:predicted DsbA family dithiol-disulfide isomerase